MNSFLLAGVADTEAMAWGERPVPRRLRHRISFQLPSILHKFVHLVLLSRTLFFTYSWFRYLSFSQVALIFPSCLHSLCSCDKDDDTGDGWAETRNCPTTPWQRPAFRTEVANEELRKADA